MDNLKRRFYLLSAVVITLLITACGGGGDAETPQPQATGKLTFNACSIAFDDSNCAASVSWTSANTDGISLTVDGVVQSTAAQGAYNFDLSTQIIDIQLTNNGAVLDNISVRARCQSASAWDGTVCLQYANRVDLKANTPFAENGAAVELEVVAFQPLDNNSAPFPTVIFNHGSTGDGSDPQLFTRTYISEVVAKYFVDRGWKIIFPQRRGRGQSDGLYDEGFNDARTAYSCQRDRTLAGFERADDDLDAILAWSFTQNDIDTANLLIAGISRGGVLSMVHASRNPNAYVGAINFVGGWIGEGCGDYLEVNIGLFTQSASFPLDSIWLYGNNDSFYTIAHSQGNFDAFINAGGKGSFNVYTRETGLNGHFIINDVHLWGNDLDNYLNALP